MVYIVPPEERMTNEEKVSRIADLETKIAQFEQEHPDVVQLHNLLQEYLALQGELHRLRHPSPKFTPC